MTPTATFIVTEADFQTGFTIADITGDSPTMQENPDNCATPAAAERLIAHLNTLGLHPVMTMDFPQPGWPGGGPFQQQGPPGSSGKVPYLDFTNQATGAIDHENAGGILIEYLKLGQRLSDYNCGLWYAGDA